MKKANLSRIVALLLALTFVMSSFAGCDAQQLGDIVAGIIPGIVPTPTEPADPTDPTEEPTQAPTEEPTQAPTEEPTDPPHTHTPGEDDGNCTTEVLCSTCGEIAIPARADHEACEDDGDVTTPIKCAHCEEIVVEAKEAIALTIPTFENGAVVTNKKNYALGDVVALTIQPNTGYAQKLTIDGVPMMLDWGGDTYIFVAEKDSYVIGGSFEKSLELNPADSSRWNTVNQAHGIISTYYNAGHNSESWWFDFPGEYKSISVKAKNYLPLEESKEGDGHIGYSLVLRINLDNDKFYAFRIINDKGTYAFDKYGASGSASGWGNWKAIDSTAAAALNGDGIDFALERSGANVLTLSINGTAIFTYIMDGVTADNKVTSVGLRHYGNTDMQVDIPFTLTVPSNEPETEDAVTIGAFANGAVTADKDSYNVGDTVNLTVMPADGYVQKLYLNGQPILVDTNSKYSFVVEEGKTYAVTGEFVPKSGWFWIPDNFIMINQGHNIALAKAGTTGELVPTADKCYGGKVLVKDPSQGTQKEYAVAFKMHFADGQKAEVRLIGESGDGKYRLQVLGNNILGNWAGIYNLSDAENAAVKSGDGVWFSMVREGTKVSLLINDNVVKTYDLSANGITADTKISQFKLQAYNLTVDTNIPYEFYMAQ